MCQAHARNDAYIPGTYDPYPKLFSQCFSPSQPPQLPERRTLNIQLFIPVAY
jgi:hypothetical protein